MFEVQLLMQIIINRIAIIHEDKKLITWLKWGTFLGILVIEILGMDLLFLLPLFRRINV